MTYDVVFLGPPGAGKSTQAAHLSERLGIPCLTAADALPPGGCVLDGVPDSLLAARSLDLALREQRRQLDVIALEVHDAVARALALPPLRSAPPPAPPVRHVHAMDAMAAAHGYLIQRDDE